MRGGKTRESPERRALGAPTHRPKRGHLVQNSLQRDLPMLQALHINADTSIHMLKASPRFGHTLDTKTTPHREDIYYLSRGKLQRASQTLTTFSYPSTLETMSLLFQEESTSTKILRCPAFPQSIPFFHRAAQSPHTLSCSIARTLLHCSGVTKVTQP